MDELMPWSKAEIGELFTPRESARFTLLWLHGQDEMPPNDAFTTLLEAHRLSCLAPSAGGTWWLDDADITNRILPWIHERWRGVAVAGVEMGGQGAIRLALKHPKLVPVAAGLGSAIDFHELHGRGTPLDERFPSRERARQDTATLHMHPSEWPPHLWFACDPADPWFRGNDRLHEKLRAYGVPHTADLESSGSDYFEAMLKPMFAFLIAGLEAQSRRLM
jgi:S-formylglutathione hydrolase